MQCPLCNSNSVVQREGIRECGVRDCTFIDMHPISFQNDVLHYEGEDHRQNRFTTVYSSNLFNGGISMEKQANFDKNFKTGKKQISDMCLLFKLSDIIAKISESRFLTILKLRHTHKMENEEDEEKNISIKNQAAYSLYSACFEKGRHFQDFKIINYLNISMQKWRVIVTDLNRFLKERIDFIPQIKAIHLIKRICRKRKIAGAEECAMEQFLNTINKKGELGNPKSDTIAALVFWKICQYSSLYQSSINLADICENHQKLQAQGRSVSERQRYFDITSDTVRKMFNKYFTKNFEKDYLPVWSTRVTKKNTLNEDDDDY